MTAGVALIINDMQNDIVQFHGRDEHLEHLIGAIKGLAGWARGAHVPVIYSRIVFRPTYVDAPLRMPMVKERRLFDQATHGSEVIDELAPQKNDTVVLRRRVSGFYNTDLEVILRGLHVDTILLTGMSTARVVESTARDGCDRDFRVIVVSDACSADTREKHENALKSIGDFFGEIMTVEAVKKAFS